MTEVHAQAPPARRPESPNQGQHRTRYHTQSDKKAVKPPYRALHRVPTYSASCDSHELVAHFPLPEHRHRPLPVHSVGARHHHHTDKKAGKHPYRTFHGESSYSSSSHSRELVAHHPLPESRGDQLRKQLDPLGHLREILGLRAPRDQDHADGDSLFRDRGPKTISIGEPATRPASPHGTNDASMHQRRMQRGATSALLLPSEPPHNAHGVWRGSPQRIARQPPSPSALTQDFFPLGPLGSSSSQHRRTPELVLPERATNPTPDASAFPSRVFSVKSGGYWNPHST
ncbi:hypothetical protein T484DRAFT_2834139 [Baffinella frigidus]|nr:hypothetical protein T484DRAFT_2834139 [Cryptophyta sp. CCMP2293]